MWCSASSSTSSTGSGRSRSSRASSPPEAGRRSRRSPKATSSGTGSPRCFPRWGRSIATRFPPPEALEAELAEAGFASARTTTLRQRRSISKQDALERIRGRYISTLRLLDEETYAAGLERAERELPEEIESVLEWAVVTAETPAS